MVIINGCVQHGNPVYSFSWGWSGGAIVLGKLPVPGCPIWMIAGQGPIALSVGAGWGGGCSDIFTLLSPFSPSLWEPARYRLK